jgi:uncharacterized protein (UPF0332 family)
VTPVSHHATASWQKAEAHLREATAQNVEASPMAIIHSSYYAMFHAARAVLFQAMGSAPKTHDRTIQHFGLLVRDLDDSLRLAGKAFNEIKDERNDADYNETSVPSADEARDALQAATDFLAVCGLRYGFRAVPPP